MVKVYRGKDAAIIVGGTTIARAQSASIEVSTGLEAAYEIGSPMPKNLEQGNVEISGSLEGIVIDSPPHQLLSLGIETDSSGNVTLKEWDMEFRAGNVSGAPVVRVTGCKADTGTLDIPQDGWLTESVDFHALTYQLTSVT